MAGRSPPRHRHDGTSPLPLGIDASPAPSRWDGAQTVWPHDPRTGWSYCVLIPSWVVLPEAKDSEGKFINPTVFFRVQVGVQSPDGVSTLRTTLRRFSDFLKLSAAVKKLFPKKRLPPAPPKNSLMRMNSSQTLLHERRHALEDWMSRLLADIDISRSVPVAAFLELEAAVRSAVTSVSEGQPQPSGGIPSHMHRPPGLRSSVSYAGGGSSVASGGCSNLDYGSDVTYDNSVVGTPSKGSEGGFDIEMEALAVEEQSAIIAAAENGDDTLQQNGTHLPETARKDSEEDSLQSQRPEAGNLDDVATSSEQVPQMEVQVEQEQSEGAENQSGLAGENLEELISRQALSGGLGRMIHHHRRRPSQESIVSEMSSAPGSELSRGVSMDVPLETSFWGYSATDRSNGEGGGTTGTGTESECLKGVGLIVPVDQRSKVRRVMMVLQRRLAVAKTDMEDLLARLNQETAVKEFLTTKVRDLESELDGMRRKSRDVLQRAVLLERERVTALQWELEESRVALQSAEETAQFERDAKSNLEESLQMAVSRCEEVEKQLEDVHEQLQCLQRERDAVDAQARADKKVLAKEIKALRASQMEVKHEAKQAMQAKVAMEVRLQEEKQKQETANVFRAKFLHEIAMLRQRLQECSLDVLAREEDKNGSARTTDACDFISTSDSRIGLLLAEAQLLAQEDEEFQKVQSSADWSSLDHQQRSNGDSGGNNVHNKNMTAAHKEGSEAAMRKMLIDAFIEQAQLRKKMNSLTRGALMSGQQRDKNCRHTEEAGISRKSLLDHIL